MNLFSESLDRLKHQLRVSKDQEVAAALEMSKTAFSERKKRGSFPEREVLDLCKRRPELGLDSHFILTGITSVAMAKLDASSMRMSNSIDEGMSFRDTVKTEHKASAQEQRRIDLLLHKFLSADESVRREMEHASDLVFVPRHDVQASAGGGSIIHDESIVDHLAFKREWLTQSLGCSPTKVCVIEVRGDSMTPTINDADLLLLDMRGMAQKSEGVYVIQLADSLLVKRLRFKINGAVDVISDNARYGTETLTAKEADQLTVLGRVVWHGRKF